MMKKTMVIAFGLSCINNHSYFFENAPSDVFCEKCGCCIDREYLPSDFKPVNKADFSVTYERRFVASLRFKDYIESLDSNVAFDPLNKERSLFLMRPLKVLKYAANQQEGLCERCHQYFDQVVPIPSFFYESGQILEKGVFSTSVEFGSGREKNPSIILGVETAEMIKTDQKKFKFRGLDINEVRGVVTG